MRVGTIERVPVSIGLAPREKSLLEGEGGDEGEVEEESENRDRNTTFGCVRASFRGLRTNSLAHRHCHRPIATRR
ncbi:hypothetical protein TcWFU_004452 [Taenia crassiceps]|uniref:Uncharacterized protein n=1 Tax=Taenia crassiceps TaxID=6207 RepID=A0ABR4QRA8_9CEST